MTVGIQPADEVRWDCVSLGEVMLPGPGLREGPGRPASSGSRKGAANPSRARSHRGSSVEAARMPFGAAASSTASNSSAPGARVLQRQPATAQDGHLKRSGEGVRCPPHSSSTAARCRYIYR